MKKFYLFSIVFISLSCILPITYSTTEEAKSIATPDCLDTESLEITDTDINAIREFRKSLFSEQTWPIRYYSVYNNQVVVVYSSDSLKGVAVTKNIALCNAKNNLKTYATEENISLILSSYGNYKQVASCEKDGVLLFQFTTIINEIKYDIKLWFSAFTLPNRALEVFLSFPKTEAVNMRKYSQSLYPGFVSCND